MATFTSAPAGAAVTVSHITAGSGKQAMEVQCHLGRPFAFEVSGPGYLIRHALHRAFDAASQRALNKYHESDHKGFPIEIHFSLPRFEELLGYALRTTVLA